MEGKVPIIGDRFPEVEVATTHGSLKLPSAFSGKSAKERKKKYECFDWWFCHKKI